jgi:alanine racemase
MLDTEQQIIPPLRLRLDYDALIANWRALSKASGPAQTGAAVKADGYGLGAREIVPRLYDAGCRDFFVAHWSEAAAIADLVPAGQISVLNGISQTDIPVAMRIGAIPVLNTPNQIALWKSAGGGRCHVMLDSGINRLGLGPDDIKDSIFDGLEIDTLHSHLASADEDVPQNAMQLALFREMSHSIAAKRLSLANSAGIMLGSQYHFDLTRPGLALYGGIARPEMVGMIKQVAYPQARILQVRHLNTRDPVGYNSTYHCEHDMPVATAAIGYADGYKRAFSNLGFVKYGEQVLPIVGRVSMDLITFDASAVPKLNEGDWIDICYNLAQSSRLTGVSQYELLTGLGKRFR